MPALPDVWGATDLEVATTYRCDELMPDAPGRLFRAVDAEADAATLFLWVGQLREAPYSYDWVDNWGRRSPRRLSPDAEPLAPGQSVMTIFDVESVDEPFIVTLRMRPGRPVRIFGDVALTYRVTPKVGGSRLVAALRFADPPGPASALRRRMMCWGDLVMMRKQLLTLTKLAAATSAPMDDTQ